MHIHLSPRPAVPALHLAYRVLRRTVPRAVDDPHWVLEQARAGSSFVFACRHGQLLPLLWTMEALPLDVVVSRSPDGELLAGVLHRRGFGLIRGSTSEEGLAAARAALRSLRRGRRIGVAVDGPRGPRGQVQDGVLRIARRAGVPIVPLWAEGGASWVAPGSWDRFEVPVPGRRVRVCVGAPVLVREGHGGLDEAGRQVAQALGGWRAAPAVSSVQEPSPSPFYGHS